MARISLFTPTHDDRFLIDLYDSIKDQPFYEWVIGVNGPNAETIRDRIRYNFHDHSGPGTIRVYILPEHDEFGGNVGYVKSETVKLCTGDVIMEVDHDDLLLPGAVKLVSEQFDNHPEVGFVYGNTANFRGEFVADELWDHSFGWKYTRVDGYPSLWAHKAWRATPASVSRIWYAPNHPRAWRMEVYDKCGGYDPSRSILDDHVLLVETYMNTIMLHLDIPLYLYRVHGDNTWIQRNSEIQEGTMRIYHDNILRLSRRYAQLNNLLAIELGGRFNPHPGFINVDLPGTGASIECDLGKRWPIGDNSVGALIAVDVLEHLPDPVFTMKEIYRVLAHGGYAFITVPSTDGRGAWQDPTHRSFWNENSWLYYTHRDWAKYIDAPVRFQEMVKWTTTPNSMNVCWTTVHLIALKYGERFPGIIDI